MGPTLGANFCHGFYLSLNGRWLKHWAQGLWMENSEMAAVIVVACLFTKEQIWRELQIQLNWKKDTGIREGQGLYNKQEQS